MICITRYRTEYHYSYRTFVPSICIVIVSIIAFYFVLKPLVLIRWGIATAGNIYGI